MTITTSQLDELERKALAATATWWLRGRDTEMVVPDVGAKTRHGSAGLHLGPSNVDHIAANSPDVTLALIARIRELERTVGQAADLLEAKSDGSARREWAKAIRKYVANGVAP
jgi:hypothetical protein